MGQALHIVAPILTGISVTLFIVCGLPLWDIVASRQITDFRDRMQELNLDSTSLPVWMRGWGILMGGILLSSAVFGYLPIGVSLTVIVFSLPRWILDGMVRKRTTRLRDQMVGACTAMANASRAGLGPAPALETISKEIKDPLGQELRKIATDYQFGKPLNEAITEAKSRIQTDSFSLFSNALQVALKQGGKETEALEQIAISLQENQRLDRKIEADTQASRKMVNILCAFPFLFLAGFSFLEPTGTALLFTTLSGQLIIAFALAVVYLVRRWSESIINIDV